MNTDIINDKWVTIFLGKHFILDTHTPQLKLGWASLASVSVLAIQVTLMSSEYKVGLSSDSRVFLVNSRSDLIFYGMFFHLLHMNVINKLWLTAIVRR